MLYADGKIYVTTENGRWAVVKPTDDDDGFEVLSKGRVRNTGFAASPIAADGRLYFPSTTCLYCLETGAGSQQSVNIAESMGEELPVSQHPQINQIQILPAEAVLEPGRSLDLSVAVYNELGQVLETPDQVVYEVEGPGSLDGATFTASPTAAHTAATITARVGDVSGTARVRIIPPLPWKFTFDDLQDPPVSWVGARYRHVIREVDGSPALTKITTIPKGARSRAWMGPSDLSEYTIAADVRGSRMSDQLPDIGLTNHGYVLDLMGESQQLQIRTWSTELRLGKAEGNTASVPFSWQEDTWYRMKFRVDLESEPPASVAVLRGKVWPRDEPEPKDWNVTVRDESPNLHASPGLYGNAKVAELYLDNIEVTPNAEL